jgi:hypothetical protein
MMFKLLQYLGLRDYSFAYARRLCLQNSDKVMKTPDQQFRWPSAAVLTRLRSRWRCRLAGFNLASKSVKSHTHPMATTNKTPSRPRRSAPAEPAVVYRGIKIAPMSGKRSSLARDIRDGLRAMYEKARAEPYRE